MQHIGFDIIMNIVHHVNDMVDDDVDNFTSESVLPAGMDIWKAFKNNVLG